MNGGDGGAKDAGGAVGDGGDGGAGVDGGDRMVGGDCGDNEDNDENESDGEAAVAELLPPDLVNRRLNNPGMPLAPGVVLQGPLV